MNLNTNNTGTIDLQIENAVATITFYHPASNSFPSSLLEKLRQTFDKVSELDNVSVIILQSEGEKTFCAGASFEELLKIDNLKDGTRFFGGFANVINAMRKCKKLIIGRVQGKAVGGGVGLISACDYVFAMDSASVKLSEIAIGIGPFVIEPVVSRKIGKMATSQLTLTPDFWKTAAWAFEKGLYSEIFSSITDLDNSLQTFSQKLITYNPKALLEIKKVFWENTDNWDILLEERAKISGELVLSDFTKEAIQLLKK